MKLPYAIGSDVWPGLSKLNEEAGEVLQVVGKIQGNSGNVWHWDGSNLRVRLVEEVGDVLAACAFVMALNLTPEEQLAIEARRLVKLALFHQWHSGAKDEE